MNYTKDFDRCCHCFTDISQEGIASSIGEQPIKGLLNTEAGARMTVAEALSNLVFAGISDLKDVKCSGNWMWAAKLPGEGAALFDACKAMCDLMSQLNIAIDGGKDSLSMAARVEKDTVKAPGTLVVSTYAPCPDVRKVSFYCFFFLYNCKRVFEDAKQMFCSLPFQVCSLFKHFFAVCHSLKKLDIFLTNQFMVTKLINKSIQFFFGFHVKDAKILLSG